PGWGTARQPPWPASSAWPWAWPACSCSTCSRARPRTDAEDAHRGRRRESENVQQLAVKLWQTLVARAAAEHGLLPGQVGLPQGVGTLRQGDALHQRDTGVLPEDGVDRVDHEMAGHVILRRRALGRGRQTRQEGRPWPGGARSRRRAGFGLFPLFAWPGFDAALVDQLFQDGADIAPRRKGGQILAA